MNSPFYKIILSIVIILSTVPFSFAFYEGMYTQSLSVGEDNPNAEKNESSQNFSYEKLPGQKVKKTTETKDDTQNQDMTYPPYYYINNYNYNNIYRIGPYYRNGIYSTGGFNYSTGGYNYKGFSYNYSIGKKPIYINGPITPIPPNGGPKPPPKPPKPNNNGGHHNRPPQKQPK